MEREAGIAMLLRQRPDIRRGGSGVETRESAIASGFPVLDAALAGGWPAGRVTEIISGGPGAALRLLLPALRTLSRREGWLAWIAPPLLPYPPGLLYHGIALERLLVVHPGSAGERLWATEQSLRSGACSAVLAWLEKSDFLASRRLQLAAREGGTPAFCLLPPTARCSPSAAAVRLEVRQHATPEGKRRPGVEILKCRGGRERKILNFEF